MKLTIEKLLGMKQALDIFGKIRLPVKVAYRTAKNLRLIMQELQDFDKAKLAAAQEFGTTEDGMNYKFEPEENGKKFNEAMKALIAQEVELELMVSTLEELGDIKVESVVLADLELLITEGAPAVP